MTTRYKKPNLRDERLTPEMITAVLAEYDYVMDDSQPTGELEFWGTRKFVCQGLALAAANAARRAHARLGSSWPIVEAAERFLAPHVSHERADEARKLIMAAQSTQLPEPSEEVVGEKLSGEHEVSPTGRALALLELAAWDLSSYARDEASDLYDVVDGCFHLTRVVASQVSESAAREFVAVLEQLASG